MNSIRIIAGGLALAGLCSTQAIAQPGLFAGLDKVKPDTATQKVQFKLPFGMSAKKARRMLTLDGFEEIDVTHVGIINAKAEACRNGKRYQVKIRINGDYEYRNEIGKCRPVIRADRVRDILRNQGYRRIDLGDDAAAPYIASACRRGNRYEIEINQYGDVDVKGRRGKCGGDNMLSPREVRRALRRDGFDRIKFTDRTPPRYVIEACRKSRKIRLNIDRRGKIRDRERIGRCADRIRPESIATLLEKEGFNRIDVVDSKPPRYRAEACNARNQRIRVAISPWGDRVNERKIGDCSPRATLASLRNQLGKGDFRSIRLREGKRHPFVGQVCTRDRERLEIAFSRWGEILDRKSVGRCISPRIENVYARLRQDGLRRMETFVEGCTKRGRKVRIELDEYGSEVNRERIGRCN